ncbi:Mis12-Mtw1 protein family-domain-containing protein [Lipomyces arxii]|uniref:Mis12-Mtw1 protein family-domain-containing protein n=1 Tax=Lipomyces arxii TaxID=56418 RepID=UPI0034CF3380
MPSGHASVATIPVSSSTLRESINLANTMRSPQPVTKAVTKRKMEEKEITKPRRAAAVAAETKILASSKKFKKARNAQVEDDDGFTFTRVRNIRPPSPPHGSPTRTSQTISKPFRFEEDSPTVVPAGNKGHSYTEETHTTIVSLPLTDTPMIRRNQQLRQGQLSRRSSLGMRGKRASSLSNGLVAVPHADIPADDFYKHLDSDLPDPHRMKQLLTWCAHRSIDEIKPRDKRRGKAHMSALAIAKLIEEEIVKDLTEGKISTSWWNRQDDEDRPRKPNPQNVVNLAKANEFKKRLERLRAERKAWAEVEADTKPLVPPSMSVDVSLLLPKEASFLTEQANREADESRPTLDSLMASAKNVEFELDMLRHSVHAIDAVAAAAEKYAEQVLKQTADAVDRTQKQARVAAGTDGLAIRDVLQTLTRIDRL